MQIVEAHRVVRAVPVASFTGRTAECYRTSGRSLQPPAMLDLLA